MKILHVLNHSPPQIDGYAIRGENLIRSQAALGWTPVVLTSPQHPSTQGDCVETICGVRYYRTGLRRSLPAPFVRQYQSIRRMAARIRTVAGEEQPDLVHAHSPCLWGMAAALAVRQLGIPMVYEVRGFWEDAAVDLNKTREGSLRYRMSRALETRVARAADAVVVIGDRLRGEIAARGVASDDVFVVPNGVCPESFMPRDPDPTLTASLRLEGTIRVGYVGTLYPWEGVDDLVRAVPQVIAMAPHARFLIVGSGTQESALRRLIADLDLSRWVHFIGPVAHADVHRYYSVLDILVYPRRRTRNTELVTPLKPLEAMAMGKAILASDVGGLCELTGREIAVRFRSGDPTDLARQCLRLIQSPAERGDLGRRCRAHVLATRNWKTLVDRYQDVYSAAKRAAAHRLQETPHVAVTLAHSRQSSQLS